MNENFHLISDALTFTTAKLARAAPRLESLTHHTTDGIQLISSSIIFAEISLNRADEFSALNYSETLLKWNEKKNFHRSKFVLSTKSKR